LKWTDIDWDKPIMHLGALGDLGALNALNALGVLRGHLFVIPAKAGIQWSASDDWVPACAGTM
jgi:hypothetical protein